MRYSLFSLRKDQSGQTLVDLIVGLALLSTAVASAGAIATTSSRVNLEAGQRAQATSLATREVEALRTYRDSNALAGANWANYMPPSGIPFDSSGCSKFYMQRAGDTWTPVAAGSPVAYSSSNAGEPGDSAFDGAYSAYTRLIKLCTTKVPSSPSTTNSNVLSVEVQVGWAISNTPKNVTLRSMISSWSQVQ